MWIVEVREDIDSPWVPANWCPVKGYQDIDLAIRLACRFREDDYNAAVIGGDVLVRLTGPRSPCTRPYPGHRTYGSSRRTPY